MKKNRPHKDFRYFITVKNDHVLNTCESTASRWGEGGGEGERGKGEVVFAKLCRNSTR